jgi:hypothetical protein
MDVQSSPRNEKPTSDLNALFEELEKRPSKRRMAPPAPEPRSVTSALLGSAPRRSVPPPPPPSGGSRSVVQSLDDAELIDDEDVDATGKHEPSWARAIPPTYDAEIDDAPTIARPSPLSLPLPLPSKKLAPPPSSVRLPPPASIAKLSPPAAALKSATDLPLPSKSKLPALLAPPPSRAARPAPSRPAPSRALATPLPALPPTSAPLQSVVLADRPSRTPSSSIPPVAHAWPAAPRKRTSGALIMAFTGLALLGIAAGLGYGFKDQLLAARATTGSIVVTAAGSNDAPISGLRVLVDGTERCTASPCQLSIEAGTHFIRAEAPGFVGTADRAVSIERNGEATLHIALSPIEQPKPILPAPQPQVIELPEAAPAPIAAAPIAARDAQPVKPAVKTAAPNAGDGKPALAKPAVATGTGTLNINSIPVANVVLDGRPIGPTPIMGLAVSPGPHTIVFVHPEQGRKATSVKVEAGKTATAAVRF